MEQGSCHLLKQCLMQPCQDGRLWQGMATAGQSSDAGQGWEPVAVPPCTIPVVPLRGMSGAWQRLLCFCAENSLSSRALCPLAIAPLNLPPLCSLPGPFHQFIFPAIAASLLQKR